MITLRLDPDLEKNVQQVSRQMGISKSELIRKSIAEYLQKHEPVSAWETGQNVFGKYASGKGNLSESRKNLLKKKILEKHQ